MKIAHVISGVAKASGPTTFCIRIVDQLAERGVSAGLYVEEVEDDPLLPQDPAVEVFEFGNRFCPAARPDILHAHALWIASSHRAITYAMRTKTPCVFSTHGMLAPWAMRHKWLKKKIAWWLYQKRDLGRVALFHVTAECEIKWLRDLGFKQPCMLAPLGADLPEISPAKTLRRQGMKTVLFVGRIYPVKGLMNLVRAWAEVRSSKVLKCESSKDGAEDRRSASVRYCERTLVEKRETAEGGPRNTRSTRNKGMEGELPRVSSVEFPVSVPPANELINSRTHALPLWQLVIAGPDQAGHKAELVAEAKRLGLRVEDANTNVLMNSRTDELLPDIVFTGPVYGEEKDALYRLADLFVLPSFTENFGVVVTDALSYGIPVITTKGTPWSELLGKPESGGLKPEDGLSFILHPSSFSASGRCGWWIDIGSDPLAEALREAMGMTDEERLRMGLNGRQLVENKYTWPAIAEQMASAYDWLLGKGKKPEFVIQ